jgi:hypothetical protein
VLAIVACGWDGPAAGVRVVSPGSIPAGGDGQVGGDGEIALERSSDAPGVTAASVVTEPGAPGTTAAGAPHASDPRVERPDPEDLPRSVAIVGDSLTLSATEEIQAELDYLGIDIVAIDGVESRRMTVGPIPPGADAIAQIASTAAPELWVIALGTNDVGAGATADQFETDVATILAMIPDDVPVVWVDLWIRDRQPAIEQANAELRSIVEARPHSIVADWFSHGDDRGIVTHDGVHLTDDGQHVFAAAMLDAMYALSA